MPRATLSRSSSQRRPASEVPSAKLCPSSSRFSLGRRTTCSCSPLVKLSQCSGTLSCFTLRSVKSRTWLPISCSERSGLKRSSSSTPGTALLSFPQSSRSIRFPPQSSGTDAGTGSGKGVVASTGTEGLESGPMGAVLRCAAQDALSAALRRPELPYCATRFGNESARSSVDGGGTMAWGLSVASTTGAAASTPAVPSVRGGTTGSGLRKKRARAAAALCVLLHSSTDAPSSLSSARSASSDLDLSCSCPLGSLSSGPGTSVEALAFSVHRRAGRLGNSADRAPATGLPAAAEGTTGLFRGVTKSGDGFGSRITCTWPVAAGAAASTPAVPSVRGGTTGSGLRKKRARAAAPIIC